MFVRGIEVKGNTYYYLVRSVRHGKAVRQEIVRYFGRNGDEAHAWLQARKRTKAACKPPSTAINAVTTTNLKTKKTRKN